MIHGTNNDMGWNFNDKRYLVEGVVQHMEFGSIMRHQIIWATSEDEAKQKFENKFMVIEILNVAIYNK